MPLTANGCTDVSKKKKSNKLSFDQKQEGPLYSMYFEIRKKKNVFFNDTRSARYFTSAILDWFDELLALLRVCMFVYCLHVIPY